MTTVRTLAVIGLALLATAGCGRKNLPVPPVAEGQPARPVVIKPDSGGLARAPTIAPVVSNRAITPRELTTNPASEDRPFILDGLLN